MKAAANPFQATGSSQAVLQQPGRERFKKIFFAVLAIHVVLFLTLLIQGCRSEQQHSKAQGAIPDTVVAEN